MGGSAERDGSRNLVAGTRATALGGGLTLRRPGWDDFAAVLATIGAAEVADYGAPSTTEQELRAEWAGRDLADGLWMVTAADGRIVGYADATANGGERVDADGYVDPAFLGQGIGTALVRATEAWASHGFDDHPDRTSLVVSNAINGRNAAARALLERAGYAEVRCFRRMEIGLAVAPLVPAWPAGIVARPCATAADERLAHAAVEAAMVDHWDHVATAYDGWAAGRKGRYGFDPALWHLAVDGEAAAGAAITGYEGDVGFVRDLAVRRPWRGRGLGRALLLRALGEFRRRGTGTGTVALNVDVRNRTGATRLYESVGMAAVQEYAVYRKVLRAEAQRGG